MQEQEHQETELEQPKPKRLAFYCHTEIREKLETMAKVEDLSLSYIVHQLVEARLAQMEGVGSV